MYEVLSIYYYISSKPINRTTVLIGNGKRNLSEFVQGMVAGVLHPENF